jgi:hypothetical protein
MIPMSDQDRAAIERTAEILEGIADALELLMPLACRRASHPQFA